MKEYYDILEIKQGSSKDEIKNAYRKLSKKYHPTLTLIINKLKKNLKNYLKLMGF
jgi:molecular chaperone DnaJ